MNREYISLKIGCIDIHYEYRIVLGFQIENRAF